MNRFLQYPAAALSALLLALLVLLTAGAPLLGHWLGLDPDMIDLAAQFQPPSTAHWLGTDKLGRDFFIRLAIGGRASLFVGVTAALVAAVIGTMLGLIAGYFGGWPDAVLMRLTDGVIALPLTPLLIILTAVDLTKLGISPDLAAAPQASLYRIIIIVALVGWTTVARLVRGATLATRERDHVRAAIALGAGNLRIMLVHIVPNIAPVIAVAVTLSIGNIILLESVLSFLGLGIHPPAASWGSMLTKAQELVWDAPALAVWPGLMIFITVIACNFLGDGLQDILDPRRIKK
jgi:peptide/nickel transport system permease protein